MVRIGEEAAFGGRLWRACDAQCSRVSARPVTDGAGVAWRERERNGASIHLVE